MDSKQLLSKISVSDIVRLLTEYYDIEMAEDDDEEAYKFRTDCHNPHNEGSFKLYLFKDTKYLHCYSCDGQMSLFDFVMLMENIDFAQSIQFLQEYFHIGSAVKGFGRQKADIVYETPKKKFNFDEKLPEYSESILNTFLNYHAVEWLNEGITKDTMDKYEIKFDLDTNSIIVPHRDIDNRLIGIRQRNLDERQLRMKRKYVPHTNLHTKITYRHKVGFNLYGININKQAIANTHKCILWESEKSVLKMDSLYNDNNISVACGGSAINEYQLNLLKQCECEDVYVLFDYEDDEKWDKKLNKIYNKIVNCNMNCYYIPSSIMKQYLELKESPIDKGQEVFETLFQHSVKYVIKDI